MNAPTPPRCMAAGGFVVPPILVTCPSDATVNITTHCRRGHEQPLVAHSCDRHIAAITKALRRRRCAKCVQEDRWWVGARGPVRIDPIGVPR